VNIYAYSRDLIRCYPPILIGAASLKGVVLAAGRGVRLSPLTDTRPKHVVPVCGKPLIGHLIECLASNGVNDILLVVGYMNEAVKNLLGDGGRFGVRISYVVQPEVLGTANAVWMGKQHVDEEDFLVVYGDLFIRPEAVEKVLKVYGESGKQFVMSTVSVANPEQYGVVYVEGGCVKEILEKPRAEEVRSREVNAGIYILKKEIFVAIRMTGKSGRREFELTDSLRILISRGVRVNAVTLDSGQWVDVGRPLDLLEANRRACQSIATSLAGEVEEEVRIAGQAIMSPGAKVGAGSFLEGPIYIGPNSQIGRNTHVQPFTSIGSFVRVGDNCKLGNSILMDGTALSDGCSLKNCVVGENCFFGNNTKVAGYRSKEEAWVIIGDGVKTGSNVSFMQGVRVKPNTLIRSNFVVDKDLP